MFRAKKWIAALFVVFIALVVMFSYELFRYKGRLKVYDRVHAKKGKTVEVVFDLHNEDWRCPLTSWSLHIRDDKNVYEEIEVIEPISIQCEKSFLGEYAIFFAKLPDDLVLKPKETMRVTIAVTHTSLDRIQFLEGYFRMVGATGDGLVKGQHSNVRFKIDLKNESEVVEGYEN